jgi:nicotinamide-nucleotide amidase
MFKNFGREMTPNNAKQAMMPEGATVFKNNYGTAPALAVESENKTVVMLPGPPREMEPIFTEEVKPFLLKKNDKNILLSRTINIFGIGESAVEDKLHEVMQNASNPSIAPYAKEGEVEIRVTASGADERECLSLIEPAILKVQAEIGEFIYGIDVKSLQNAVYIKLRENNLKLASAESCTGGLIGKRLTEISGVSSVYYGGVVAYDNSVKINMLGVNPETLKNHGAVSEQTACEMARGIAERLGADIGVSTTGIAGPDGGTDEKPVGLVYVGIYYKNKTRAVKLNLSRRMYKDEREMIRYIASSHALREVLREL